METLVDIGLKVLQNLDLKKNEDGFFELIITTNVNGSMTFNKKQILVSFFNMMKKLGIFTR